MWTYGGAVACTLWNKITNSIPLGSKTRETDHFGMTLNFLIIYTLYIYCPTQSCTYVFPGVSNSFCSGVTSSAILSQVGQTSKIMA